MTRRRGRGTVWCSWCEEYLPVWAPATLLEAWCNRCQARRPVAVRCKEHGGAWVLVERRELEAWHRQQLAALEETARQMMARRALEELGPPAPRGELTS